MIELSGNREPSVEIRIVRQSGDAADESREIKGFNMRVSVRVYFQVGDRIIEVDGVDLRHGTHERAVEVIQAAGNPVCLLVQSLVHLVRPRHDQEYRCTPHPHLPHYPEFSHT